MLLLPGPLLLRLATRQLIALLFQLPPRSTRFDPDAGPRPLLHAPLRASRSALIAWSQSGVVTRFGWFSSNSHFKGFSAIYVRISFHSSSVRMTCS